MNSIIKYPLIHHVQKEEIISKIKCLSEAYTPEWHFNKEQPDIGSVIALIYAHMLKESMDIVNRAMNKHHVAFLNCLDLGLQEAIPAECFATFEVAPTLDKGVFIPKDTKLLARAKQGGDVIFSTCHSVYVTTQALTEIIFTSQKQGKIIPAYEKGFELVSANIKFFDFTKESIQGHRLSIAHPYILKGNKEGILRLHFESNDSEGIKQLADKEMVEWQIITKEDSVKAETYLEGQSSLCLKLTDIKGQSAVYMDYEAYWIEAKVKDNSKLPMVGLKGIALTISNEDLKPSIVYVQDKEQSSDHFMPFGNPLELYSECYIKCEEAFSKHGAAVTFNFNLEYIQKENVLTLPEEAMRFKYIMRKPHEKAPIQKQEIRVDEVLWDYWNGTGWVRLFDDSHQDSIFNGKRDGEISISFKCPKDIEKITVNAYEGRWIRLRMLRADNIYSIPSVEIIPVIHDLKISYTYNDEPLKPKKILIHNNTYTTDITRALSKGNEIIIFKNFEYDKPACFIGFEKLPEKSPLSIFFDIKTSSVEDTPALSFEYSTYKNNVVCFENLKVSDGTKNLKNSGNMIFILPEGFQKVSLFSKERYWIKVTNENAEYDDIQTDLPHIQGIYFNTARVMNQVTKTERHHITDPKGIFRIKLQEKTIIGIKVFINERVTIFEEMEELINNPIYNTRIKKNKQGEVQEFWVKWQQKDSKVSLELEERNYYVDKVNGEIIFPDNIFVTLPVAMDDFAIEVHYEICDGTRADIDAGMISGLQSPIPFISRVYNPVPAFGSSDFESVEKALVRASHLLENRDKAVSIADYETIIKTYASSISRVKCLPDVTIRGQKESGCMTIAILTDDYDKGSHTFLSYKESLEKYILAKSSLNVFNRRLYLREPIFIELSAHVWLSTDDMEKAYEFQYILQDKITKFFDPLHGHFDGRGWEIGIMPKHNQLDAYLKSLRLDCSIQKIILTAKVPEDRGKKEKDIDDLQLMPFALPISGEHKIVVSLR
ncbi:MAG: hypothetical protein K0S71_3040 [Clostridia bacterium]|jgi:hypothetical protein|nr:hypothetical protein [Clostridia bacterium]